LPTQVIPKTRRRLSEAELNAWKAFVRAARRTSLALDRAGEAAGGLPLSEHFLIVAISEGPPSGIRPTDLAERSYLTKSGLTRAVDRLEGLGLVERRSCPSDKRGYLLVLSAKGRRYLVRSAPAQFRAIATHFADLIEARELEVVATALERVAAGPPID
jgi:DNA-binding MarR family transcriptional regulator